MKENGPILILEDDEDDQFFLTSVLASVAPDHPVRCFDNALKALDYLRATEERPFLIISDVNLSPMTGLEFRRAIDREPALKQKSIPFVFMTSPIHKEQVKEAYNLSVQGFFEKGYNLEHIHADLAAMIAYWSKCIHPNNVAN